jgi:uncharacterized protein (DUF2141 family)
MPKYLSKLAFAFFIMLLSLSMFQRCAQTASPPGGKKDTLAPKIISSIPLNKSKNYSGKKVELNFNEYVGVRNLNQELLITPNVGTYDTRIRPMGITLIMDSTLKQNTTYTFNFRNAIEDVSERNIGKNIKLVFSTGSDIDSLQISGQVKHLETNKKLESVLVGLYPYTDTLRIDKVKPYYFTKTDTSGIYQIENVAAGKYYMAAFADINNNLLYNSNKELVDFITQDFIDLNKNQTQDFRVALQNQDPIKINKTTSTAKTVLYELSRGVKSLEIQPKTLAYQVENNRNLRFYVGNVEHQDTVRISAIVTDSLNRVSTLALKVKFREPNKKEKIVNNSMRIEVLPASSQLLSPSDSIIIKFPKPIAYVNTKLISFISGPDEEIQLPDEAFTWNSYVNELSIDKGYLPLRQKFDLKFAKHAFVSVEKDSSQVFTQGFEFQDLENYGSISGGINVKQGKFIFQLIKSDNKSIAYQQKSSNSFSFPHVEPGLYELRAIEDRNGNGIWDLGNFRTKEKPESIYFFPTKIKLKANFQITDLLISPE